MRLCSKASLYFPSTHLFQEFELVILLKYIVVIIFVKVFLSPLADSATPIVGLLINVMTLILLVLMMLTNEDEEGEVDGGAGQNNADHHNRNYVVTS